VYANTGASHAPKRADAPACISVQPRWTKKATDEKLSALAESEINVETEDAGETQRRKQYQSVAQVANAQGSAAPRAVI
jgi:hypothetical protein